MFTNLIRVSDASFKHMKLSYYLKLVISQRKCFKFTCQNICHKLTCLLVLKPPNPYEVISLNAIIYINLCMNDLNLKPKEIFIEYLICCQFLSQK